jgi:hypothetical protein
VANAVEVYRKRLNVVRVSMEMDVSQDAFSSEIRTEKNSESTLLATWTASFATDGTDGELLLTLDDSDDAQLSEVTRSIGYMDVKRITNGKPMPLFDGFLEVVFKNVITE